LRNEITFMEGTPMVALSPFSLSEAPVAPTSIKLLDLLTNRYHLGIIRESSDAGFQIELPASSRFHAGQRVRFIVAGEGGALISKTDMHRAFVTNVSATPDNRLDIHLAFLPETAVA
jgi:hypothetical protein